MSRSGSYVEDDELLRRIEREICQETVERLPSNAKSSDAFASAFEHVTAERGIDNISLNRILWALGKWSGLTWKARWDNYQAAHPVTEDDTLIIADHGSIIGSVNEQLSQMEDASASVQDAESLGSLSSQRVTSLPAHLTSTPSRRTRLKHPSHTLSPAFNSGSGPSQTIFEHLVSREADGDNEYHGRDLLSRTADRFLTAHLGAHAWDKWRGCFIKRRFARQWEAAILQQLDSHQRLRLTEDSFVVWRVRAARSRRVHMRADALARLGVLRKYMVKWEDRTIDICQRKIEERERIRQEAEDRLEQHASVLHHRRISRHVLKHWQARHNCLQADNFYLKKLAVSAFTEWRDRQATIKSHVREACDKVQTAFKRKILTQWSDLCQIHQKESLISERRLARLIVLSWTTWTLQLQSLCDAATFHNRKIAQHAVLKWRRAMARASKLEQKSEQFVSKRTDMLPIVAFRMWLVKTRECRMTRTFLQRCLQAWRLSLMQQQLRDQNRVIEYQQGSRMRTLKMAVSKWRLKALHWEDLDKGVIEGYRVMVASKVFSSWRGIIVRRQMRMQKAGHYRNARLLISFMRRWQERRVSKLLETLCYQRLAQKLRHDHACVFHFWLGVTRRERLLHNIERSVVERNNARLARSTFDDWKGKVMTLNEYYFELGLEADNRVLKTFFGRWQTQAVQKRILFSRLETFGAQRLSRLHSRCFDRLRLQGKEAATRKRHFVRFEKRHDQTALATNFSRWRRLCERHRLTRLHQSFVAGRMGIVLRTSFDRWKAKTTTLPAVSYHARRVTSTAFSLWRLQFPLKAQENVASAYNRRNALIKNLTKWKNRRRELYARRQVARFRARPIDSSDSLVLAPFGLRPALTSSSSDEEPAIPLPPRREPRREGRLTRALREGLNRVGLTDLPLQPHTSAVPSPNPAYSPSQDSLSFIAPLRPVSRSTSASSLAS